MSDPKFFRKYLDILDEQNLASANIGNAKFTADKTTNTMSGTYDIDDNTQITATKDLRSGGTSSVGAKYNLDDKTQMTATQDLSKGGASSVGMKTNVDGVNISTQHNSPAYNKGQLAGTSNVSAAYKDTQGYLGKPGQTHTVTATKGVGFQGAGANVKPGQNIIYNYSKTN